MDIQMPVMDGYMATKKIRNLEDSDLANIPIIALSANAFEEDRKASADAGMNGHLAKPVNVSELLKMLCKLF
ncbi:response regulator [Dorea formicigenerans]|nr:response regulator [Dorea formicigenerans]